MRVGTVGEDESRLYNELEVAILRASALPLGADNRPPTAYVHFQFLGTVQTRRLFFASSPLTPISSMLSISKVSSTIYDHLQLLSLRAKSSPFWAIFNIFINILSTTDHIISLSLTFLLTYFAVTFLSLNFFLSFFFVFRTSWQTYESHTKYKRTKL